MKVAIRADSSIAIGSGHIMRCLTFANYLKKKYGAEVVFICRALNGNMNTYISEVTGFTVYRLSEPSGTKPLGSSVTPHAGWLEVSISDDCSETLSALQEIGNVDWLVVDHYALNSDWEKPMRPYVGRIMVIDDLADRQHDCDLLLDQNLYQNMTNRYDGLVPEECINMLGPQYSLLRPEFYTFHNAKQPRDGAVRRILIFFGGSDPSNETLKALDAINLLCMPDMEVNVVVGEVNVRKAEIKELCASRPRTTFHCQVDNMAELMMNADLAIGAGGSSLWERCCLGLPSIVVAIATNQILIARQAAECNAVYYIGEASMATSTELAQGVKLLMDNPELLRMISRNGKSLVDGNGLIKVTETMFRSV